MSVDYRELTTTTTDSVYAEIYLDWLRLAPEEIEAYEDENGLIELFVFNGDSDLCPYFEFREEPEDSGMIVTAVILGATKRGWRVTFTRSGDEYVVEIFQDDIFVMHSHTNLAIAAGKAYIKALELLTD